MRRADTHGLAANADLRHFKGIQRLGSEQYTGLSWLGLTCGTIAFFALMGWLQQRDDAARMADAVLRDTRLGTLLTRARCAPADAPLEKLVGPIASQADGKPPALACIYITADLGVVPQIRFATAEVAH